MEIQHRILKFVTRTNWILFCLATILGFLLAPLDFVKGIIIGGLLVTINFHLLSKTLKKAFTPPHISSHRVILFKYYVRFVISGILIFFLIAHHWVHPLGLIVGLSVVVVSIILATIREFMKFIVKEAV